jgi:hypothetical protein
MGIVAGAGLSAELASPQIAVVSVVAFTALEIVDALIYTRLRHRSRLGVVAASNGGGLVADSVLFMPLAFGSFTAVPGQIATVAARRVVTRAGELVAALEGEPGQQALENLPFLWCPFGTETPDALSVLGAHRVQLLRGRRREARQHRAAVALVWPSGDQTVGLQHVEVPRHGRAVQAKDLRQRRDACGSEAVQHRQRLDRATAKALGEGGGEVVQVGLGGAGQQRHRLDDPILELLPSCHRSTPCPSGSL